MKPLQTEDNLDVIRCSDWIIDLGSDGGGKGGQIVATGTPEAATTHYTSRKAHQLKQVRGSIRLRSWQVERWSLRVWEGAEVATQQEARVLVGDTDRIGTYADSA